MASHSGDLGCSGVFGGGEITIRPGSSTPSTLRTRRQFAVDSERWCVDHGFEHVRKDDVRQSAWGERRAGADPAYRVRASAASSDDATLHLHRPIRQHPARKELLHGGGRDRPPQRGGEKKKGAKKTTPPPT